MKKRVRLLLVLALTGVAAVGIYAAAAAAGTVCGAGFHEDGITRIKKEVVCDGQKDWNWTINKSADQSSLTLAEGEQYDVHYTVQVNADLTETYTVSGTIRVRNLTPSPVMLDSVTDTLGSIDCGVSFPYELPASTIPLTCTFSFTSSTQPDSNTARVTYADGTYNEVVVPLDWSGVTISETDKCVDVSDTLNGFLGTVCGGDHTFTYTHTVGPYETCGPYQVNNTASFVTSDTGAQGSSSWTVDVDVPCGGGCSLTPGYWKTHSSNGPAPYDDTWASIGEGTPFFYSGQSYYAVLWTSPHGNAYYILAHAYIAAELNGLNGADLSAVQSSLDAATALFDDPANTPAAVGDLKGSARNVWINLASTLDDYNNGLIGPGHCSE